MRARIRGFSRVRRRRRVTAALVFGIMLTASACGSDPAAQTEVSRTDQGWAATKSFDMRDRFVDGAAPTIWTGHEAIIVGGLLSADQRQVMESPAYEPSTDSWRTIAPPPVVFVRDTNPARAVWTGAEVLLLGTGASSPGSRRTDGPPPAPIVGAAYNPTTDSWRQVTPPPPDYYRLTATAWSGDRLLAWTQGVGVASYDPSADQWATVPAQPAPADANDAIGPTGPAFSTGDAPPIWDGTRLIVFGGYSGDVAAFDPTAAVWTALPDVGSGVTAAAWTGTQLLAYDSDQGTIALFDATHDVWNEGPTAPFTARATPGTTAWTGTSFAVWAGLQFDYSPTSAAPARAVDGATYDVSTNAWTPMPALPDPDVTYLGGVWANDTLFTWGASGTSVPDGAIRAAQWHP